jgi:hypothetical protein
MRMRIYQEIKESGFTKSVEVWEKEPDISAIKELLDRAIDKPKETLEIEDKTDWDGFRARIAETRRRLALAAAAATETPKPTGRK